MKIDRLLGIVTVLLQREKVTAPELAKRFEVSRRTVQRDIEDICKAGIPVVTFQGGDGGISIAEGFKLDKNVLSVDELQHILAGLKSIGSVTETARIEQLISKLSPENQAVVSMKDSILIDLSSHYKPSLSEKINLMKRAISENRLIGFDYFTSTGYTRRVIEPYFILFKWTAWYLFGYCRLRRDFRLFKLNRLWKQELLEETFAPRAVPPEELDLDDYFSDDHQITVFFDPSVEYLLIDAYGPGCYEVLPGGQLKFTTGYTNQEHMISWIFGFGDKAAVVEPVELVMEMKKRVKNMMRQYEHDI